MQVAASRLQVERLAWLPAAANAATGTCFVLSVSLAKYFIGGTDLAVPVLAPILLLLNQDAYLLKGLTPRRRYAPPIAAVGLYLGTSALLKLAGLLFGGDIYSNQVSRPCTAHRPRPFRLSPEPPPVPRIGVSPVNIMSWSPRVVMHYDDDALTVSNRLNHGHVRDPPSACSLLPPSLVRSQHASCC